jgi:DNA helicase II / ATP-dependent DNA helicase PcrA
MASLLTLAVAGSRKTQGLANHCAALSVGRRALVLTYTQSNQAVLRDRLKSCAGDRLDIEVLGWFTFLLRHFARPFLPFKFPGQRVQGFNFEGRPHQMASGIARFLDSNFAAYACELSRLASELIVKSRGALMRRLSCIYDEILIDEVQDFSGHDWTILDALLDSPIEVRMVGDIRQAVLSTNPRGQKNRQYGYANSLAWFREREKRGILCIEENSVTWRCQPDIAAFSDTIFDSSWSFPTTESKNLRVSGHDGVFLLHSSDVQEYVRIYGPRCLRHSATSGKKFELEYLNFKLAKGSTFTRVLVVPTSGIANFIQKGLMLEAGPAANFYVAVTRAEQSVAIVVDDPGDSRIPYWRPT